MQDIQNALKKYWGYDSFRPLQREAMQSVRDNRDSLVVLPTGGGKSLCFQAPAITTRGMAIVVSPLISLMKDQVDALTQCGVAAARIDSAQTRQERDIVFNRIESRSLKLLYLSPERMFSNGFIDFLKKLEISFFAIDEAHCISMWGHDFRPEYRQLGQLKTLLPGAAVHAYTATATPQVRDDIVAQLHLDKPEVLVGSFDRPNLIYKTERSGDNLKQVCAVLDRHPNESGIIYCIRRLDVDGLCEQLSSKGYQVLPYHAGMDDASRKRNQEAFIQEKVNTIVATVAFGMGIDKSNVRYVIHTGMPKSLEHYQQESGRAGRDGLEAECILFYSGGDYGIWRSIMRDAVGKAREVALQKLSDMYDYCTGVTCRHRALLRYFGQDLPKSNCAACDVCLDGLECVKGPLIVAQKILSCIKRLDEKFGAEYTAQVLVGSRDQRILNNKHDALSTYNLLSEYDKKIVREWIEQLAAQGYLRKNGDYNTLSLTEAGWRVIRAQETPRLLQPAHKPAKKAKSEQDSWKGVDRDLFNILRESRSAIAEENLVPAFTIFSDASLREMARLKPTTLKKFREIHGVGESKCKKYGPQFIFEIREYCEEQSSSFTIEQPVSSRRKAPETKERSQDIKQKAFALFQHGVSMIEIADHTGRAFSTLYSYLVEYIEKNRIVDSRPWVEPEDDRRVVEVAKQANSEFLKPIFEMLNGEIPYEEIKVVLACQKNREREKGNEIQMGAAVRASQK